jgi:hypothetical protein
MFPAKIILRNKNAKLRKAVSVQIAKKTLQIKPVEIVN